MSGVGRRLTRVEQRARVRLAAAVTGPGLVVVDLAAMPAVDRSAVNGDDPAARADAVERQTGHRPGPRTLLILLAMRPDGPA